MQAATTPLHDSVEEIKLGLQQKLLIPNGMLFSYKWKEKTQTNH